MSTTPTCPACKYEYIYEDESYYVCPDCSHRWTTTEGDSAISSEKLIVKDANGTPLQDGDTVTVIKDLKLKGSSVIKVGTRVKKIRLVDNDHNIDCRIEGVGAVALKSEFVKKV
jgi:protein PhnA